MTRDPMPPDATLPGPGLDARRRRILYRATHRGTKEADLLVGGFVAAHVARMDAAALDAIEAVLELPDTDLADWLTGRRAIPEDMQTDMLRAMAAAGCDGIVPAVTPAQAGVQANGDPAAHRLDSRLRGNDGRTAKQ